MCNDDAEKINAKKSIEIAIQGHHFALIADDTDKCRSLFHLLDPSMKDVVLCHKARKCTKKDI